jgi:hypothetical protein
VSDKGIFATCLARGFELQMYEQLLEELNFLQLCGAFGGRRCRLQHDVQRNLILDERLYI